MNRPNTFIFLFFHPTFSVASISTSPTTWGEDQSFQNLIFYLLFTFEKYNKVSSLENEIKNKENASSHYLSALIDIKLPSQVSEAVPQGLLSVSVVLCHGPVASVHPVVGRSCLCAGRRAGTWGGCSGPPACLRGSGCLGFGLCWSRPSVTQMATFIPHTYVWSRVRDLWTPIKSQAPAHAGTPYICGVSLPLSSPWPLASLCPSEAPFVLKALAHGTVPTWPYMGGGVGRGCDMLLVHSRAALRQAGLMFSSRRDARSEPPSLAVHAFLGSAARVPTQGGVLRVTPSWHFHFTSADESH